MIDCEVAIVGAGPVGLTLANLLGDAGIRVVLIERNPTTVQEPRAVSIDDEALRTMQAAGLVDQVLADVAQDYGSHYFTPGGICFAKVEPATREFGFPRRNAFTQPRLEATLRGGLARYSHVTTLFGHDCGAVADDAGGVTLDVTAPGGAAMTVRARYLAACDGGRSAIRKAIGATLTGLTYRQRWLILDLGATREQLRQTRVLCNPDRAMITLPGPGGIRRYEFLLREDEADEIATAPGFVRGLLAAHGPDAEAPIVRARVYAFHARTADRWRSGHIFLAGDAAHLTPPFAGQGMNSGVRDAHNLAWKFAAVLRGRLGESLLDTYQQEREPHARALIRLAVNMGQVMMPASPMQAWAVQAAFRLMAFVPPLHAWFAQMKYKPKPFYGSGFVLPGPIAGRMLPQPLLDRPGAPPIRLDQLIGNDFALIAYGRDAQATIAAAAGLDFGLGDLRRIAVLPAHYNPVPGAGPAGRDIDDVMVRLLPRGREALLLLRPDRYVAAAMVGPGDVAGFAADVRRLAG